MKTLINIAFIHVFQQKSIVFWFMFQVEVSKLYMEILLDNYFLK